MRGPGTPACSPFHRTHSGSSSYAATVAGSSGSQGRAGIVTPGGGCQKTVAQSFLMLTIVQPLLAARSSACSAPAV